MSGRVPQETFGELLDLRIRNHMARHPEDRDALGRIALTLGDVRIAQRAKWHAMNGEELVAELSELVHPKMYEWLRDYRNLEGFGSNTRFTRQQIAARIVNELVDFIWAGGSEDH